jgi:hypothetical protein
LAADLQTRGEQTKDDIMYIMLTRAVKGCTLWLHTEPLGYPGAQLTDDHADDDELSQHEKLVALTAKYEYTLLLHLQQGEDDGFQFAPNDDGILGRNWWSTIVTWTRRHVLNYYLTGDGFDKLRKTISETFGKSLGNDLATSLSLLPGSQLVNINLQDAKRARTSYEGAAAQVAPPLLGNWAWPVPLHRAVTSVGVSHLLELVVALGARTVDCVTIRPSSVRYAVTAVPLLEPFPGLPDIPIRPPPWPRTDHRTCRPHHALGLVDVGSLVGCPP